MVLDPVTVGPVTRPSRDAILQFGIQQAVAKGWRVESVGPGFAVLVRGDKASGVADLLHVILSVFTCGLWLPVWLVIALLGGERRATLTVVGTTATLSKATRSR